MTISSALARPAAATPPPVQTNLETLAWWTAGLSVLTALAIFGIGELIDRADDW